MTARTAGIAPWRRGYDRAWLGRDVIGGLAAGAVVIPQAMAYATIGLVPDPTADDLCSDLRAAGDQLREFRSDLSRGAGSFPRSPHGDRVRSRG